MQADHLPRLSPRFWLLITVVSIFGANLGDFCSHELGLGHSHGVPLLALAFAAILLAERRLAWRTELFYWLAVIVLRTAATNLADLATHDFKVNDLIFLAALAVPLAGIALVQDRRRWLLAGGKPTADGLYWLAMLLASVFGTALGDYCADLVSLGISALLWLLLWAAGLALVIRIGAVPATVYWAMVCVIRTFGTNVGDWLTGHEGLALGLPLSTGLSALVFAALYAAWRPAPTLAAAE